MSRAPIFASMPISRRPSRLKFCLVAAIACLAAPRAQTVRAADVAVAARSLQFPEGTVFVGDTLYFGDYTTSEVLRLAGELRDGGR
jgi:hypothetical protein